MCSRWHEGAGTAHWANAKGNTSHRDVPVHGVCKSGDSGGGGTVIRRERNSQGQGQTTSSGRRERDKGIKGIEGTGRQ